MNDRRTVKYYYHVYFDLDKNTWTRHKAKL